MRIEIDDAEREELVRLVESYLSETRVELRRTQTTEYREKVRDEGQLLAGLLEKLRHASSRPSGYPG